MPCENENNCNGNGIVNCPTVPGNELVCPSNASNCNLTSTCANENANCDIGRSGCVGGDLDNCEKNICSFKASKLLNLVCTAKLVYQAIHSDISDYIYELASLQEYFGQSDLNDEDMFNTMTNWYNQLTLVLYNRISNHLSTTTAVEGHGKHVIKKWKNVDGEKTTTHKYQNVCERQISIPGCEDKLKHRIPNKYYGKGDTYLIQYSKNVVTYDNMVINKLYREVEEGSDEYNEELNDGTVIVENIDRIWNNTTGELTPVNPSISDPVYITGLNIRIGNHGDFTINNGSQMKLDLETGDGENPDSNTVAAFYQRIDAEQKNLCELQRIIQNNIDFIQRYQDKFVCMEGESC